MRWFRRKPRHHHDWKCLGYGGAGWFFYRCTTCGKEDIG